MAGIIISLLAAAAAQASTADFTAVSPMLDSLVGKWSIVESAGGKESKGFETWSVPIPNQMYLESRDTGTGADRHFGTAVVWRASKDNWRAVWCDGQRGCVPLRFDARAGELIVSADESAPAQAQAIHEHFRLTSANQLDQLFEMCPTPDACRPIATTHGRRQ